MKRGKIVIFCRTLKIARVNGPKNEKDTPTFFATFFGSAEKVGGGKGTC